MHFQMPPHAETKLVRAVRGRAYDVVIDLRRDSPAYLAWFAIELDADAMNAVFIPPGCAHGFLTLQPDTDILYQISPPLRARTGARRAVERSRHSRSLAGRPGAAGRARRRLAGLGPLSGEGWRR